MKSKQFILAIFILAALSSCQKSKVDEAKPTGITEATLELVYSENEASLLVDDLENDIDYYSATTEPSNGLKSSSMGHGCATITKDYPEGEPFPVVITIDFGEACEGWFGRIRSGKVIITKTAYWYEEGATRTVTFEDHFVDSVQISGTKSIVNNGEQDEVLSYTTEADITLTWNDGKTVRRVANKTRSFIAGMDTPWIFADNVIEVTGSVSVTSSEGESYSKEITEPLVINGACHFIVSGIKVITENDETPVTIDYGDGSCDNKATITKDGESQEIDLGWKRKNNS